jgi:hypothetical protein
MIGAIAEVNLFIKKVTFKLGLNPSETITNPSETAQILPFCLRFF